MNKLQTMIGILGLVSASCSPTSKLTLDHVVKMSEGLDFKPVEVSVTEKQVPKFHGSIKRYNVHLQAIKGDTLIDLKKSSVPYITGDYVRYYLQVRVNGGNGHHPKVFPILREKAQFKEFFQLERMYNLSLDCDKYPILKETMSE